MNTYSNDPQHHLSHLNQPSPISPSDERQADTQSLSSAVQNMPYTSAETGAGLTQRKSTKAEKAVKREDKSSEKKTVPDGLLSDIMTFRWMTVPGA